MLVEHAARPKVTDVVHGRYDTATVRQQTWEGSVASAHVKHRDRAQFCQAFEEEAVLDRPFIVFTEPLDSEFRPVYPINVCST